MKPETFVRAANLSELKGAGPFALSANGVDVVLARSGGGWRAFGGRCPHQGALLGEGELDGGALVCRNHGWRFALDSGQRDGGPECLASCPVAERNGALFVDIAGFKPSAARIAATRSLDDLPGPKPLPLIGNLHQLDPTKAHLILEEWAARYGSIYQFRMGRRRIVATTEPALIEDVLRARPETFRRPANMDRIIQRTRGQGRVQRRGRGLAPTAQTCRLGPRSAQRHRLFPSIQIVAGRLKTRWEQVGELGETLDMVEELKRFTVDVTMLIVFGHDANTVEQENDVIQSELGVILPAINRRLFALVPTWRYVQTPSDRRLNARFVNVRAWLDGLLTEARARLKTEPERAQKPSNFLEAMVTTRDENGKPFSDDVIMSNLLTMLIAGEDTTAFTLAWAIHQLCDSPQWAAEIRREADAIVGASVVAGSHDVASRLICAGAVASETMRLRPVGAHQLPRCECRHVAWRVCRSEADDGRGSFSPGGYRSGQFRRSACIPAGAVARGFNEATQRLCLYAFWFGSADVPRPVARASRDEDPPVDALQELRRRPSRRLCRMSRNFTASSCRRQGSRCACAPDSMKPSSSLRTRQLTRRGWLRSLRAELATSMSLRVAMHDR